VNAHDVRSVKKAARDGVYSIVKEEIGIGMCAGEESVSAKLSTFFAFPTNYET
jgi:hypothetical protein